MKVTRDDTISNVTDIVYCVCETNVKTRVCIKALADQAVGIKKKSNGKSIYKDMHARVKLILLLQNIGRKL